MYNKERNYHQIDLCTNFTGTQQFRGYIPCNIRPMCNQRRRHDCKAV